ncbi:hypothetical protein EV673_1600 [Limnobacter thiooxidans]|uniref:Uncharacterized protein n=1 Tax=Limnobacter thiooxidans TaxID=131080 RepID=A0AA86J4G9_9BURK|nr:hypothetical protein EV673_1600 [Limnobacter thiooxidans]BET24530.1 hypothetical protein RGQ30_00310 [Limnobacter thiooxidans]
MNQTKNLESVVLFNKTKHAAIRSQQRGVSQEAIEFALTYGKERHVGQGCMSIYMDKIALSELRSSLGVKRFAKLENQLTDLYLIVSDDDVITVARAH